MNVVVDTNVFVSSFFGGKPREIIRLWQNQRMTLCLSKDILEEYMEVLRRLELNKDILSELMELFARGFNILFTRKTPSLRVVKNDPDDDKFIECAAALKAEFIITGDKELLSVRNYNEICIITPADFLELFKPSS